MSSGEFAYRENNSVDVNESLSESEQEHSVVVTDNESSQIHIGKAVPLFSTPSSAEVGTGQQKPVINARKLFYHPTLTPLAQSPELVNRRNPEQNPLINNIADLYTPGNGGTIRKREDITPDSVEKEQDKLSKRGKQGLKEATDNREPMQEIMAEQQPVTMDALQLLMKEFRSDQQKHYAELSTKMDNLSLTLRTEIKEVVERALDAKVEGLEKKLDNKIENAKGDLRKEMDTGFRMLQGNLEKFGEDIRKKEEREQNVIIGGIDESQETDVMAAKKDDIQKVKELVELTKQKDSIIIKTAKRLGEKKEGSKRLVKMVLANKHQRDVFLHDIQDVKRSREGRNKDEGGLDYLIFTKDRSWEERQDYKRAKEEKDLRERNGERNLKIVGDKVVTRRQPFREAPRRGDN